MKGTTTSGIAMVEPRSNLLTATAFPLRTFVAVPATIAVYDFVLHWVYRYFILDSFRYAGFRYEVPNASLAISVFLVTTGTALVLPRRITRPSGLVLWVLFVVVVAPSILMAPYLGFLDNLGALSLAISGGLAFSVVTVVTSMPRLEYGSHPRLSTKAFWYILAGFSAIVYVSLARSAGLSLRFLSVLDVYDVRGDYSDVLEGSALVGYLVSTQANVINPVLLMAGLCSRRWLPLSLGVLGQLVLYSSTGFKTILFSIPAVLIVWLLFRVNPRPNALKLVWGCTGLLIASSSLDYLQNGILWSSLLARRFLFTPARLTSVYADYYSSNPWHLLGNSTLGGWLHSPYRYGPPRNISIYLTGSPKTSMNANLFADGFAQFGLLGVVLMSLMLFVYLRVLDRASNGLPVVASSLIVLMSAVTLTNSSIMTSFLSHGLLVAVLIVAVVPRGVWSQKYSSDPL